MEIKKFKEELSKRNGISLNEDFILFNDYELYSIKDDKSKVFKSLEEVLKIKIGDKTVEETITEKENVDDEENGGRGSSSSTGAGIKIFGRQRAGRKTTYAYGGNLQPAYLNSLTSSRFKSVDKTAKAFGKKMLKEYREYSGAIDADGFATKYNKGGTSSTAHLVQEGGYSLHNHPTKDRKGRTVAWNIYSKQDLQNSALDNGRGTIVVSNGNRTMYKFTKTHKFKAKEFVKALNKAESKERNYDKAVDSWLRKNQKTYGYKYKKSKF